MKRKLVYCSFIISTMVLFGCSQEIKTNEISEEEVTQGEIVIEDDSISKKYYSKDISKEFSSFILNPQKGKVRSAENKTAEEDMFLEIWSDLSDEEKEMLIENADKVEVANDSLLSVQNETSIGRAVLQGDTTDFDSIALTYAYLEWLDDCFGEYMVKLLNEGDDILSSEEYIPANIAIDYLSKLEKWDDIENILKSINSDVSLKDIQSKYNEIAYEMENVGRSAWRASSTVDYQTTPIRRNVGITLKDGTVLLTCCKKKAYPIIGGKWAHAGIFSNEEFLKNGKNDSALCVYTAQPDAYSSFPSKMQPDRPNHCCLDTICMYTYQKKMATMLPKNYSTAKAKKAVNYAKKAFYDTYATYRIPVNEFFRIGNTSHDMSARNPYCSKVVYSAWNKAGVNLDSNTFGGNLVTPDDLYGSAFTRYRCITIRFLFWSKTWKTKIYSSTSVICTEEHQ